MDVCDLSLLSMLPFVLRLEQFRRVSLEWVQWLYDLKNGRHEHVRRATAAAFLLIQIHLDEYYKCRLLKKRVLAAMESSIEQVTTTDSKETELLYEEFDGKLSELSNMKSVASGTLLFNEEGQLAEEGWLLDAVAVHACGILPIDDKESCATTASRLVKSRRKRASQQSSAISTRHVDLDHFNFRKLASSGRCVEDVLFDAAVSRRDNVKALFSEVEWEKKKAYNQFSLPKLPKSTAQHLTAVRNALASDEHPDLAAVPREDRYSCDLIFRTVLSWVSLYAEEPSAFANSVLTEAFWCCEAWPLV
ncbi:hypothetical protein BGZ51_008525 [Haplosporangium sp. Z 767]|nr:hypothetical protein BGZ51_008525 [Haplosporangium sp. Z 767]KAF9196837.1 hypothetical protein BGZ50_005911 [Haplosporangium sp. Z 11]